MWIPPGSTPHTTQNRPPCSCQVLSITTMHVLKFPLHPGFLTHSLDSLVISGAILSYLEDRRQAIRYIAVRKFYGRHHELVNCYGISVSQITADMFSLSYSQKIGPFPSPLPSLITGVLIRVIQRGATSGEGTAFPSGAPDFSSFSVRCSFLFSM